MELAVAVARLDAWLDTMRGQHGYAGPVAHWWESNFTYTGALYDWRYEGIIDGYRLLYLATRDERLLDKAVRAADDVVRAQLPDGRFRNSSFQFGPVRGGTPHEASIDVALLALAVTLRDARRGGSEVYEAAAEVNLERYWLGQLWNGRGFQDQPYNPVLVANKHGTLLEAWLRLSDATGRNVDEIVLACIDAVRRAQVHEGAQAGGTVHRGIGPSCLAIPLYTARAMNGILSYYEQCRDASVLHMLTAATAFIVRSLTPVGVTWGVFGSGRPCPNPRMVAGAGDVLRFLTRMRDLDLAETSAAVERLADTLISQQRPSGGLPTAHGFARKGLASSDDSSDLRDELAVVGWVDKSFRALSLLLPVGTTLPPATSMPYETCVGWRGRRLQFRETPTVLELRGPRDRLVYLWRKGERAPDVYEL